jgi:PAS domain S-box-containing protein
MHTKRLIDSLKGVIITHIDITEHRRAELTLRDTQARLALVVEEVKAGYWDWDLLSNSLYLSPEWKSQIGFDEHELANRRETWEDRLHPDDRTLVWAATENYIAGRQPVYELEFRLCHKDGSYRWIHCRGGLLHDQNNQPYRMLGINLDITDYKNRKEQNERRVQMEQTYRHYVARQTAAAIAHELNQPLTAIYSYADVARQLLQNGNPNPEKLSHILENCALQALRAGEAIRQLLELLHKGETKPELIAINQLVHNVLDFIKADGYSNAFKIELDLSTDLPLVLSNHLHFQKVLVNLIRNGLESMQEIGMNAGSITITTRRFTADPAMVEIIVRDCGKGMPDKAELKKMFQHFYTTKPTGLGMGLAISRSLIETHGGKMWAVQNADHGLSIHFTLPFIL